MRIVKPNLPRELEPLRAISGDDIDGAMIERQALADGVANGLTINNSHVVKTDFSGVAIEGFGLKNTTLADCIMTAAKFPDASWHVVEVANSRCSGMQLDKAHLKDVRFTGCKLDLVNCRFAKLTNVVFDGCVVSEMDFYNAELKNVTFIDCDIEGVEFAGSKLQNVDLTASRIGAVKGVTNLKGAIISGEQLIYLAPYLAAEAGIRVG